MTKKRIRPMSPRRRAQLGGIACAANAAAAGRADEQPRRARAAAWRKLGADVAADGTLLDTPATRQARRLNALRLAGVDITALLPVVSEGTP